jgi:hypothetical protein
MGSHCDVCEIDESGVAGDAADIGCWNALFVQGFDHGSNLKVDLCLATKTRCCLISQGSAHLLLGIFLLLACCH